MARFLAAVATLGLVLLVLWFLLGGRSSSVAEADLAAVTGARETLTASATVRERAEAVALLGSRHDLDSVPDLLAVMAEDPDSFVRARAAAAVQRILQIDHGYRADDPLPIRQAKIALIHAHWESWRPVLLSKLEQGVRP